MIRTLATTTCLIALGCGQDFSFEDRRQIDTWAQAPTDQVDILFVVDNSNSMQLEQSLLAAGFDAFIGEIEGTNVDFQIGVISTDFDYDDPNRGQLIGDPAVLTLDTTAIDPETGDTLDYVDIFRERALVGLNGSGKEKGMEAAAYALSPLMTTGPNEGFLRTAANLLIVFVSDEDDCSDEGGLGPNPKNTACYQRREDLVPVTDYADRFVSVKGDRSQLQVAAIVGPEEASSVCQETTLPGLRYIELARLTGGLASSICSEEAVWRTFLGELGLNASGIFTVFELTHGAKEETLVVEVDGVEIPQDPVNGYTYDDVAFTIEFHGDAVPERGATITARYAILPGT